MKTRVSLIIAVVIVFGLAGMARATLADSNSIVKDNIEYYVQTDKSVYDLGEDVQVLYRVTNLRDVEWRFNYIPPIVDILVAAEEGGNFNEIWNWGWDKIYPAGPVVFQLEPNESAEISGIWPQINLNGSVEPEDHTPVSPGIYRTSGVFYPTDSSVAVDIAIIPEPTTFLLLGLGGLLLRNGENLCGILTVKMV